jgi:hypothetical protein
LTIVTGGQPGQLEPEGFWFGTVVYLEGLKVKVFVGGDRLVRIAEIVVSPVTITCKIGPPG